MAPPSFGSGAPEEPTRLRQIALAVTDLEKEVSLLTSILPTHVLYRDPRVSVWNLHNALLPLGGDILELVSPTSSSAPAARHIKRNGDGGYMIIMQQQGAKERREQLVKSKRARVIWTSDHEESSATQYHPADVPGGVIPELDAQYGAGKGVEVRFGAWHALGPRHEEYVGGMRETAGLGLLGVVCRLKAGEVDVEGAARRWRDLFGVAMSRDLVAFTNARLGFVRGVEGKGAGIESITVGVAGREKLEDVIKKAREKGVWRGGTHGWAEMCGVKWHFVQTGEETSKL
ncbi:hypothetical protein EJ06DRAFT_505100 [Trichodelitschia bisporula]|uniref:Glyoxalase-like domain-containing protein n=1 Tax=Trichodelitschia bisporula TaxID=703511 RepID=A0A6G1I660_9PEZI|nr:hypothetical protein EJ06DRAFT_505100 [Trichodelitschia bisporula]